MIAFGSVLLLSPSTSVRLIPASSFFDRAISWEKTVREISARFRGIWLAFSHLRYARSVSRLSSPALSASSAEEIRSKSEESAGSEQDCFSSSQAAAYGSSWRKQYQKAASFGSAKSKSVSPSTEVRNVETSRSVICRPNPRRKTESLVALGSVTHLASVPRHGVVTGFRECGAACFWNSASRKSLYSPFSISPNERPLSSKSGWQKRYRFR